MVTVTGSRTLGMGKAWLGPASGLILAWGSRPSLPDPRQPPQVLISGAYPILLATPIPFFT